jgi:Ser/Thr protein kinase RdoA (MazF antagonist)
MYEANAGLRALLDLAPTLTSKDAATIARDFYNVVGAAHGLQSERDQNFFLTTQDASTFVLKIANSAESRSVLQAQNAAMSHLASRLSFCPRLIPTRSGEEIATIRTAATQHYVRLVTYISGMPLAREEQTPQLLFDLGRRLGELTRALSDFGHPAFHREFHWDLRKGPNVITEYAAFVRDKELHKQLDHCFVFFDSYLSTDKMGRLPCAIIHGDPNDYNVLVQGAKVVGLIDFGDMIYSYRVGELAIALAYVVLDKPDPLASAKVVVDGYLSETKLSQDEIEMVWPLLLMRLCMSVCLAAYQSNQNPDNDYLDISQRPIRESLPRLLTIDPLVAAEEFQRLRYDQS